MLDPRLDPTRGGQLAAKGQPFMVVRGVNALRKSPQEDAEQVSQLRYGEIFNVYEHINGWAWGQCARDNYVGYLPAVALLDKTIAPTHRINNATSFVFVEASIKSAIRDCLTFFSPVEVVGGDDKFKQLSTGGFIHAHHLTRLADWRMPDFVAAAERLMDVPYLWGGLTPMGIDCSGLVQLALNAAGIACPRDSDMQAAQIGQKIAGDIKGPLQRGDLVFMPGHVGIMADPTHLLHANAYHGKVVIEPLAAMAARQKDNQFTVRRL